MLKFYITDEIEFQINCSRDSLKTHTKMLYTSIYLMEDKNFPGCNTLTHVFIQNLFNVISLDQRLGETKIKSFYLILLQFSCFFFLFSAFICEKHLEAYFDQCLECAEPKRWSKYTTVDH